MDDFRAGFKITGSKFWPGQIHDDAAIHASIGACFSYVDNHALPDIGVVVRAVDPGDVHACVNHLRDQVQVACCLGRQRHHDAYIAVFAAFAEYGFAMLVCFRALQVQRFG